MKFFKTIIRGLMPILAVLFLYSCEGMRVVSGVVLAEDTALPLDSVKCAVLTGIQVYYTDTTGKFDVSNKMGPCFPECRDITVEFSKEGYSTYRVDNPDKKEITVVLKKQ